MMILRYTFFFISLDITSNLTPPIRTWMSNYVGLWWLYVVSWLDISSLTYFLRSDSLYMYACLSAHLRLVN